MENDHQHNNNLLFTRIAQGDEAAFKKLYLTLGPKLSGYIYRLTKSKEAVRDVLQESLFRLWVNREKLLDVEKPQSWLFRVVANECYRYLRTQGLLKRLTGELEMAAGGNDRSDVTEIELSYRETQRVIQQAVSMLSPKRKEIYILSREQGLKIPEIAAHLGLSEQYVKKTLMVSLRAIRQKLLDEGIYLPLFLIWLIS